MKLHICLLVSLDGYELICSSSMSFVAIACKLQSVLHDDTCLTQLVGTLVCLCAD